MNRTLPAERQGFSSRCFSLWSVFLIGLGFFFASSAQQQIPLTLNESKTSSSELLTLRKRADRFYSEDKYPEAIATYRKVLTLDPNQTNVYFSMAGCYFYVDDFTNAAAYYEKFVSLKPRSANGHYWHGRSLNELKNYQSASSAFRKACDLESTNALYFQSLGYSLAHSSNHLAAVPAYERARELDPTDASLKLSLADEYYWINSYDRAIKLYQNYLSDESSDFFAHFFLGLSFYEMKRYAEALPVFRKCIQLKPESSEAHYWLGYSLFNLSRYEEAANSFHKSAEINPKYRPAPYAEGLAWLKLLKFDKATASFEKARALNDSKAVRISLFICYLYCSQYHEAYLIFPLPYIFGVTLLFGSLAAGLCLVLWKSFQTTAATAPGIVFSVGWILLYIEGQLGALFLLGFFRSALQPGTFVAAMFLSAVPLLYASIKAFPRQPWGKVFPWAEFTFSKKVLFRASAMLVGVWIFNALFTYSFTLITHKPFPEQRSIALIKEVLNSYPTWAFLYVAVLAPILEEILFRGLFYGALQPRLNGLWVNILTAACFALIHFQMAYFVPLFAFGLLLGWCRRESGSIWLPSLIHIFNNSFSLLMLSLYSKLHLLQESQM